MRRLFFTVLLGLCLMVNISRSQESTGNLEGRVLDSQGLAISFADIMISSPSLQGLREDKTDKRGYFRAVLLPVGSYTVKIGHAIFQEVVYENVPIRLGKTTTLGEIRLEQRVEEEHEITVTAEKPIIDPISTRFGANLESDMYESLPISRNFRSIISLIPQANTSYYGDEVNISGSTGQENIYFIDGIHVTEPVRATMSTNLPYNFVKEIQIKSGGYEAEYGRALGGIINVITHSGGNEFRGQVFGFFTNHTFAGEHRAGLIRQQVDTFSTYDFGLSLGGPIVRDKLWFFLAYNPNFEDKIIEIPGLGSFKDRKRSHLFAGKLSWQATKNTNIVFTILGDPGNHEKIGTTFADALPVPSRLENPDPYLGDITAGGINLSLRALHIVNRNFILEASIFHNRRKDRDGPATDRGQLNPFYYDTLTGELSGGYGRIIEADSNQTAVKASGSLFLGRHQFKAGITYEDSSVVDGAFENMAGSDGLTPSVIFRLDQSFYWAVWSTIRGTVHNRYLSLFAQDSWMVSKRLRLNVGLRWDGQYFVDKNGEISQRITDQWQPRIGFTYQMGELGSQRVYGSYGRYFEQVPLALTFGSYTGGTYYNIYYFHDPRISREGGFIEDFSTGIRPENKQLEGQHFDEFVLGYERRIGDDFKIGIRGIYRTLRQVIEDIFDPKIETFRVGNPGEGDLSFIDNFRRNYTALEITFEKPRGQLNFFISYVLSRNHGNYPGLTFTDSPGVSNPNISTLDFPEQLENATGLLPNDRPHVFKFYGSYHLNFGLSLGTFFILQSGTPLNEMGTALAGPEFKKFLRERGTAGRTPAVWDWNIRLKYDLGRLTGTAFRPKLILDIFHVFSQREALLIDQTHFLGVDAEGNQIGENPNFLKPTFYQEPMTVRLGFELDF